jgi:4-amino-4-deoxy-L-arabinose transferase-like glycosyltransferase
VWFGVVLALGFLTREFAIYAVPALIALSWWHGTLFRRNTLIHWALVAASFVIVWDGVQMLKPYADLHGPGSRGSGRLVGDSQLANLTTRLAVSPVEIPARVAAAVGDTLPHLVAGRSGGDDMTGRGRDWMGFLILTGLAVAVARSIRLRRVAPAGPSRAGFGAYLMCVGAVAVLAFVVSRPVDNAPLRYALLALYLPIGITAVWLGVESDRRWRRAGLGVLGLWAALSLADHARMAGPFVAGREPDPMGDVARALEASDVQVAEADYWRAYRLTFLTGERVIVASTDFIRIDEYQNRASAAGPDLGRLQDTPCDGGQPVATWYLCPR